jgi:5-(carboxyamino)imidazole ribonucleotide mutase
MKVLIIFGSQSDKEVMKNAKIALDEFGIMSTSYVLSAHRVPERLEELLASTEKDGYEVIIAGAGLAAHLPGVIASKTILPVIGVPLKGALEGLDALYSIVQMPKPIPVATVGINNAYNAGILAAEILGVKYPEIRAKLIEFRSDMKKKFLEENAMEVRY